MSNNNPEVISYGLDQLYKTVEKMDHKLDRIIENYATKVELSEAISERNEKIVAVERRVDELAKKRNTTDLVKTIVMVVGFLTAFIALYESFR